MNNIRTTIDYKIIYKGVEKIPTNESIQYLEEVDSTGCFIELGTQIYRLVYSDFTFNEIEYNDYETFKTAYFTALNLTEEGE